MSKSSRRRRGNRLQGASGVMLIETAVAVTILLIVIVGILPLFVRGFQFTQQQGDTATRTTEYAQDKMEQLMALSFNDGTTDVSKSPTVPNGCVSGCGLGGTMAANAIAGAVPPAAPVAKFVDYTDSNGNILGSSTGADYIRQWSIATGASLTLKTITVAVTSLRNGSVAGAAPSSTVVCIKAANL